ncbi:MAG: hypothetical protein BWK77_04790 [Verrucomicrobia bacterium A1]|nr:MAG: hypothetical protein BWK77_04790 [Verrucomicrobia bacterium A1]
MKFKIDENLPCLIRDRLRSAGHDAVTVIDQDLGGQTDRRIAEVCTAERRILVTCDADFGNIRAYPPGSHAGVILLSARVQSVPEFDRLLEMAVRWLARESVERRLWIVEADRIRVRGD